MVIKRKTSREMIGYLEAVAQVLELGCTAGTYIIPYNDTGTWGS
jgi:hypothetical protein